MPDPSTITAIATATALVLGAVTKLLAELRRWRRTRSGR